MGIEYSLPKRLICNQSSKEFCFPITPLRRFDKDDWPSEENGLVTEFLVVPEKILRGTDDGSWFWWTDAQFLPFDDTHIVASGSAFTPRPFEQLMPVPNVLNGRVLLYSLKDRGHVQCEIFSRTYSSVHPKVQPHPLGQMVCYCGTGEVVVMTYQGDPIYTRSRDLSNAVHVYCAISKNGIMLACLKRGMNVFFLETNVLDSALLGSHSLRCQTICPGFLPGRGSSITVRCKFSPNSKLIAVSSSGGYLFVVKTEKLEKFCIICPDMLIEQLSADGAFDFHPRFPYEVITLGTKMSNLVTVDIQSETVLNSVETEERIDCVIYSPDGLSIAVGFHDFDIKIFDSSELICIHSIPMSDLCLESEPRVKNLYPSVHNLSFSQNAEHLLSTSCDGKMRLWRIPRLATLQELCRDSLLKCIPIRNVKKLEIPEKVKKFLLYKYF